MRRSVFNETKKDPLYKGRKPDGSPDLTSGLGTERKTRVWHHVVTGKVECESVLMFVSYVVEYTYPRTQQEGKDVSLKLRHHRSDRSDEVLTRIKTRKSGEGTDLILGLSVEERTRL